jgi:hypothetical protein
MKILIILLASVVCLSAQVRQGRGPDTAPKTGAPIPAVSAKSLDGKQIIDLSKPKRLTILIFGSHT